MYDHSEVRLLYQVVTMTFNLIWVLSWQLLNLFVSTTELRNFRPTDGSKNPG